MSKFARNYLTQLRQLLSDSFNEEEIRTLAFDLQVDYESLPGRGKVAKVRELIAEMQRNDRIPELVSLCVELRPNFNWTDQSVKTPEDEAAAGKRRLMGIGIAAGAVMLIGTIAFILIRPQPLPSSTGMVEIKADAYPDRFAETAAVGNFWIDRYEVTNAQYHELIGDYEYPESEADLPAHNLSWDEASEYCLRQNKRLPSEAEWALAARGPNGLLYPWGNDSQDVTLPRYLYPVGTVPINRSFFGVFDMFSNVAEWVDVPYTPVTGDFKVSRGSAFDQQRDLSRALPGDPNSSVMIANIGVRCAADEVESISDFRLTQVTGQTGIGYDEFTSEDIGWPNDPTGDDLGYHQPDFYHLTAREINVPVTAFFTGESLDNFILEADLFVDDDVAFPGGDYRHGLAFRHDNGRFYAFVINIREKSWAFLKFLDSGAYESIASGTSSAINGRGFTTADAEDRLTIIANGPDMTLLIDGEIVGHVNDTDITNGEVGFFAESLNGALGHFHFDRITLQAIDVSENYVRRETVDSLAAESVSQVEPGEVNIQATETAMAAAATPTHVPPTSTATPAKEEPTETAEPTAEPTVTLAPSPTPEPTRIPPPDDMVFIAGGSFLMGSSLGEANEQPEHTVRLDAYFLDLYEVSNEQYLACVAEGGCTQSALPNSLRRTGYRDSPIFANYPVIGVTRNQAAAYCEWVGKRLPTEAEWEFAASGPENFTWPWGNEFEVSLSAAISLDTEPIDSFAGGVSPFGVFNMAGNVNEWVQDRFDSNFYANSPETNPVNLESGSSQIYRGGSFDNRNGAFYTTSRRYVVSNNTYDVDIGFRCAQDIP